MTETKQLSKHNVCIVVPLCNELDSLDLLRARLASLYDVLSPNFNVHCLFVDDGSTDGTGLLLPTVSPSGASVEILTHDTRRGVGAAFRTAFQHARGEIVCTIDADCSYGPENLLEMIEEIQRDRADVVVASPYHPDGGVDGVQTWRLALSSQASRCYRTVSPLKLYTYTSIFRAYRASVVRDIEFCSDGFVSAVEILLSASNQGYRISERPLVLRRRVAGVSKMKIVKTVCTHLALLAACVLSNNRGYPAFCRKQHHALQDGTVHVRASEFGEAGS